MKKYNGEMTGTKMMDAILSGAIKQVNGEWYWTEYHVAYAQRPMDTSENFVTLEEANAHFEKRLADLRKGWGCEGRYAFSEEVISDNPESRRIRFRSIRKNGKPGTLTGLLYMNKINRPE